MERHETSPPKTVSVSGRAWGRGGPWGSGGMADGAGAAAGFATASLALAGRRQRRRDAVRLLHQVPAITEFAQLDSAGKEQLRISRVAEDVVGSQTDFSEDP